MLRRWDVLVVCAEMNNRNALTHMLEGMSVGVYSCSTLSQAMEVIYSHKIELIFCEENLPDGSFREFLQANQIGIGAPHVVVIGHLVDSTECTEVLESRGFEVISLPLHPTDVELAVIRAMRNGLRESFFQVSA
jgi:DNA-binding NtrC family response regulator